MDIRAIVGLSPVVPIVTMADPAEAVPMARALLAGGLSCVEVTLRTAAGLPAIRAIAREVPGLAVGAGTVLTRAQFDAAIEAGAAFVVAPGLTPSLLSAAKAAGTPFLPGVASPSELMLGLEYGLDCFKFFPAVPLGAATLASLRGPFPGAAFCATGGITPERAPEFLALANVLSVGATWVAPAAMLERRDWAGIEKNARKAAALLAHRRS
jgi:2-dehydro-3-deoxyphosphogluconate aldolase/(4S)-4-hydroxy-2-oxoglutarate aldolase